MCDAHAVHSAHATAPTRAIAPTHTAQDTHVSRGILYEFCAENAEHIDAALAAGARRIELCDNLFVGGTTPSYGVIKHVVAKARAFEASHGTHISIMVMIRPRGGNFIYTTSELKVMCEDICVARELGSDGVVFGCLKTTSDLNHSLTLDGEALDLLLDAASTKHNNHNASHEITFHMAFDELSYQEQFAAIDELSSRGITRILTHGGPKTHTIEQNATHIQELIAYADDRIDILPGAGITWKNAADIATQLGVSELHGTKIVKLSHEV